MAIFGSLGKYRNSGLLIIRLGLGAMFILHGYPKLLGGPDSWTSIGGAMQNIGIKFFPIFWGLMAALTETLGGFLLIIGLAFRPACLLLFFTMGIATLMHFSKGDDINVASHAIEAGIVFLGLMFIGPGKYSVDKK
jgi:putative oxidoreductase